MAPNDCFNGLLGVRSDAGAESTAVRLRNGRCDGFGRGYGPRDGSGFGLRLARSPLGCGFIEDA